MRTDADAVTDLDARTPCDEWTVWTLLNHMLGTQLKPEISVADDASPQERLLAYTGREPR
jgi:hypothetical protein